MSVRKVLLWTLVCAALVAFTPTSPALAGDGVEPEEGAPVEFTRTWYSTRPAMTEAPYEYTNTTPLPVPDSSCAAGWVSSVITVPDSFLVNDLNVGVWMTHTYRGDVEIQLRAPDGTTVLLIADLGGSADNINALFDDSAPGPPDSVSHTPPPPYYTDHPWTPVQPLSGFSFVSAAGDWTLDVCDDAGGDTGTVEQWTLFFDSAVGVGLNPVAQGVSACSGDDVVYDLQVSNATGAPQVFNLTYTGNSWAVTGPPSTGTIPDLGAEAFSITHSVPLAALPGDSDTVTVEAAGGGYSDTATATTEVPLVVGWGDLAELTPTARPTRNHSTVYYNGKLYKIGGYDGAARPYVDIYDIATDTWSTGADMPISKYWQDCVEIGAKIYCAGGYTSTNLLHIYDIATDTWSTGANLPASRYNYAGVALGGKYYVIGGYTTTYQATTIVYDPVTNTWDSATVPNMSVARRYFHAGAIGGKIYVAGGYNPTYLSSAEVYDPVANTWSPIASMPSSWVQGGDGVLLDRYLVITGGASTSTATASNGAWIYDAVADRWSLSIMEHFLYGSDADSDGATYWIASGRGYDGAYLYAPWTTRAYACADRTDLAITKDDGVTEAIPGLPVTYTITATNNGPVPVRYASVYDDFPGLSDVTWTCVATGTGSCAAAGIDVIDDTVNLGIGDTVTYTATGTVASSATGTLDNTAYVFLGSVPDLVPANNEATDSDLLTPVADLVVTKTDGLAQATLGQTVTYTIVASNPGPSDAIGSTVADTFNALFLNPTWTCAGAGGGTCTGAGTGNIADLADIPAGGSVTYTATGTIDFAAPAGPNDNVATVTPSVDVTDPDPTNNSATDLTDIVFADLSITKDDGVTQVAPGDPVTYTIVATNNGPNDVTGGRVVDTFVAELLNVTWTCVGSGGGVCTAAGTGDIIDVVNLPNAATVTYTVQATVDPNARGVMVQGRPSLVNTALVISNVDVADPNLVNNAATDVDTIELTDVDLAIDKTDNACYVLPGGSTTYTITVTNLGPAEAVDAAVVDTFPAAVTGVTWTCVGSGGASCTPSGTGNINDTVTVPVFGSVTYSAVATVDAGATGSLTNTATVDPAMGITDLDLTNNASSDTNALEMPVFCDGFESGTTDAWSSVLP